MTKPVSKAISLSNLIYNDTDPSMHNLPGALILSSDLNSQRLFDKPRRLDAIGIIICEDRNIDIDINNIGHTLTAPGIITFLANDLVQVIDNNMASGFAIAMSPQFINYCGIGMRLRTALIAAIRNNPVRQFTSFDLDVIRHYFPLLSDACDNKDKEIATGLLKALSNHLARIYLSETASEALKPRAGEIFKEFMDLLNEKNGKERTLEYYARQMNLSPNYLSRMVKTYSGKYPAEWINDLIIAEGVTLLNYTDKSIKEISFELHFPSQSAFSKFFRHKTGLTPMEYRKSGNP